MCISACDGIYIGCSVLVLLVVCCSLSSGVDLSMTCLAPNLPAAIGADAAVNKGITCLPNSCAEDHGSQISRIIVLIN